MPVRSRGLAQPAERHAGFPLGAQRGVCLQDRERHRGLDGPGADRVDADARAAHSSASALVSMATPALLTQ